MRKNFGILIVLVCLICAAAPVLGGDVITPTGTGHTFHGFDNQPYQTEQKNLVHQRVDEYEGRQIVRFGDIKYLFGYEKETKILYYFGVGGTATSDPLFDRVVIPFLRENFNTLYPGQIVNVYGY